MRLAVFPPLVLGALAAAGTIAPAQAQSKVQVVLSEVVDDRISEGMMTGGLVLSLNLEGTDLEKVESARFRLREAKTDGGKSLLDPKAEPPDFTDRNVNGGNVQVSLASPPREAKSVRIAGTAELFVPSRDPASLVRIPGFAAKLDKKLESKGLKAAKVELTVLSREKYAAEKEKDRLDEAKIAKIRAEGKARGMKDEEIDAVVEMAKAFEGIGGDLPEHGLFLSIPRPGEARIQEIRLETAAGEPIETGSSASSGNETGVLRQVELRAPLPKDAVLVVSLFTDKSLVSVPFELKEVLLP